MDVLLVYSGLLILLAGLISVVKPLRILRISARRIGTTVLCGGPALALLGALLASPLVYTGSMRTHLDYFMPAYQFREVHTVLVKAPPARVFRAVKAVTPDEILFFRTLTWIRSPRLSSGGRESLLNAPRGKPMLDVATSSGFLLLAEEPDREIAIGTVLGEGPLRAAGNPTPEDFLLFIRPGHSKVAMNFHIEETAAGLCRVTSETRVFSTDPSARRIFGAYWRLIYPGSAIIRRMWLRAIERRAERA